VKKARIVLLDRPAHYRNRHLARKDNPSEKTRFGVGVAGRYAKGVMSDSDSVTIGELIRKIAAPDAYILSWVTLPNTPCDMQLLGSTGHPGLWGTEFKTMVFVWVKTNVKAGTQFCGGGSYNFANAEMCALARYPGTELWHPNNPSYKPMQVIFDEGDGPAAVVGEPHTRYPKDPDDDAWDTLFPGVPMHLGHPDTAEARTSCPRCSRLGKIVCSRKPESVQNMLDAWLNPYLDGHAKVELFATRERPGWICLGGDISGNDIYEDVDDLAEQMACETGCSCMTKGKGLNGTASCKPAADDDLVLA
jgi:N6-adenosine-specific RNA methylase IME4